MELTGLKGKVAVVTGAARARGIGRDTAVVLGAANRGDDRQAVTDLPLGAWHTVMNTNNDSVFLVSRAFARQMLAAGKGGSIVNISSIAGKVFGANTAVYASSKAAMQAITKVMCRELGAHDIRVNAICPGLIDTARMDDLKGQEGWHALVDRSALGRAGEPIDIAWMVAFLCSDQARWISGQAINVDGGSVLEA